MITANSYSSVLLTKEVIEGFKKRFKSGGKTSCICFTSAMMSHGAPRKGQTYAASKVLVDFFAHGLNHELAEFGVDVMAWRAAGVATKIVGEKGGTGNAATATPE